MLFANRMHSSPNLPLRDASCLRKMKSRQARCSWSIDTAWSQWP